MLLNPFIGSVGVGSSGSAYFFEERFEGTGYQNTWDETGTTGTANEDYTTSPLEGSQSLLLSSTAAKAITITSLASDQDELWGFFKLRPDTLPGANRTVFALLDASDVIVFGISIRTAATILVLAGTIASSVTIDTLSAATNYNLWWHFLKGTGANSVASCGFTTGTTEPTSGNGFCSRIIGDATTDARKLVVSTSGPGAGANTTAALVFDQILISNTATIGDNPA